MHTRAHTHTPLSLGLTYGEQVPSTSLELGLLELQTLNRGIILFFLIIHWHLPGVVSLPAVVRLLGYPSLPLPQGWDPEWKHEKRIRFDPPRLCSHGFLCSHCSLCLVRPLNRRALLLGGREEAFIRHLPWMGLALKRGPGTQDRAMCNQPLPLDSCVSVGALPPLPELRQMG